MNEKKLIKELWNLWESLALCGQLSIGPNFVKQYNELKAQVEQKLNIHNVVRGGYNETEFFKRTKKYISYPDSNTTQPTPTEPLKSEGQGKKRVRRKKFIKCAPINGYGCDCMDECKFHIY